jgi:hypothetical protein
LIEEYDIQSAQDIEAALRDLLGGTIQNMLECELEEKLEQSKQDDPENDDSRRSRAILVRCLFRYLGTEKVNLILKSFQSIAVIFLRLKAKS